MTRVYLVTFLISLAGLLSSVVGEERNLKVVFDSPSDLGVAEGVESSLCDLSSNNSGEYVFSFSAMKVQIPVHSSEAQMVSCERWADFEDLIVAKINFGGSESPSQLKKGDLFVFKITHGKLLQVYEKPFLTEVTAKSDHLKEKTKSFKENFLLVKSADGKPGVRWKDTKETDPIAYP